MPVLLFTRGLTFLNVTLVIGVFLGLSLAAFLLLRRSGGNKANPFLGAIVLLYAIFLTPGCLEAARLLERIPHFANVGSFLFPLLGPLIYFYVRTTIQRAPRLRPLDGLHLVPFLIFLALDWRFIVLNGTEKYAIFERLIYEGVYPYPRWETLVKLALMIGYYVVSVRLILVYREHLRLNSSHAGSLHHRWLLFFSSALLVPLFVSAVVILTGYDFFSVRLYAFSFVFFNVVVHLATLYRPSLFQPFPNLMDEADEQPAERRKYESSTLEEGRKTKMVARLLDYVRAERPYLEPELTLGQLAAGVGIPAHYLSQVINEKVGKSFGDFINEFRVERAKNLLGDERHEHLTILAIAYEAGFNSKTAFYDAFRRFVGVTPSKFRKQLKISSLG